MLKREVAIKVLPAGLAGEAARISRFQREAELLASLSHSNIAIVQSELHHGSANNIARSMKGNMDALAFGIRSLFR